ncbi:MAG: MBL fold metallo-hydrolase [Acidobacteriota bacterium]
MKIRLIAILLLATLGPLLGSCGKEILTTSSDRTDNDATTRVTVLVLGTAQDGGLPHTACSCVRCERARSEPTFARNVASIALIIERQEHTQTYIFDATPDITDQLTMLRAFRDAPTGRVDRSPIDGVFLTHAHIGHYLGLAHFGFEVVHTQDLPVWATPKMNAFLRGNAPWEQLVGKNNVALHDLPPGETVTLPGNVHVSAFQVPHRDEYSDTVGFRIDGAGKSLVYVPDTDQWHTWDPPLEDLLTDVDIALLDATFYSLDELPGRDISQVRHPLITQTMDRLQEHVDSDRLDVYFTHLNHSNPALQPESDARRQIEKRGFGVAADGQVLRLD